LLLQIEDSLVDNTVDGFWAPTAHNTQPSNAVCRTFCVPSFGIVYLELNLT